MDTRIIIVAGWMLCSVVGLAHAADCDLTNCAPASPVACDDLSCFDTGQDGCGLLTDLLSGQSLIKQSDHCFDDFISPMTNPLFFEDPRTLTEARFIFVNHNVPDAVFGGDVQYYALQIRAALTDNLSFIANKDGFIVSDNVLIDDGWADVALGLKYNLFKDTQTQSIISVGTTVDLPFGSTRSLQGNGDGEFHIFASAGTQLGEQFHYVTGSGFRLPVDTQAESQVWYWSNHLDYQFADSGLYLFGEANWYHWLQSGNAFGVPVEGIDLFNLGSAGVAGNDIVTGAIGVKYSPSPATEIGIAWELPLTDREDIMKDRFTFDWIIRY